MPTELLLRGGVIHTMAPARPRASALHRAGITGQTDDPAAIAETTVLGTMVNGQ